MNHVYAILTCLCLLLVPHSAVAGPVDLNSADATTLARELKGIGEVRARAIVEYRRQNGPFRSVDELALVKGIGPRVIERNRTNLRVGRAPAGPAVSATPAASAAAPARRPVR